MSFSRPIQWYHSHADPIWPDGTFISKIHQIQLTNWNTHIFSIAGKIQPIRNFNPGINFLHPLSKQVCLCANAYLKSGCDS